MLMLELLAAPSGVADAAQGADGEQVLVGRSVLAPFDMLAADGAAAAVLAAGQHKLVFDSSSCLGSLGVSSCWAPSNGCSVGMLAAGGGAAAGDLLLPLNWRAMLGDTAIRAVPDPSVQLELQPCGKAPQLPGTAAAAAAGATASSSVSAPARASTVQAACAHVSTVAHTTHVSCVEPASSAAGAAATAVEQGVFADTSQGLAKSLGRESPTARSLQVTAHHLEEAANIPVQVRHTAPVVHPHRCSRTCPAHYLLSNLAACRHHPPHSAVGVGTQKAALTAGWMLRHDSSCSSWRTPCSNSWTCWQTQWQSCARYVHTYVCPASG